jgi:hypothetical protein
MHCSRTHNLRHFPKHCVTHEILAQLKLIFPANLVAARDPHISFPFDIHTHRHQDDASAVTALHHHSCTVGSVQVLLADPANEGSLHVSTSMCACVHPTVHFLWTHNLCGHTTFESTTHSLPSFFASLILAYVSRAPCRKRTRVHGSRYDSRRIPRAYVFDDFPSSRYILELRQTRVS